MSGPRSLVLLFVASIVAASGHAAAQAPPSDDPDAKDAAGDGGRWCAPELAALEGEVCAKVPSREADGPRTLVIFLHGVIQPDSGWQWAQQRAAARAAATHGFSAIMPRGRRGRGPAGMEDWWTWPNGVAAQAENEVAILGEWARAKAALEEKSGKPFERVWIFGFSNGAYYATSLALRGRLSSKDEGVHVDGFAAFAGGSGGAHLERAAKASALRTPLFVAWGGKDKAHRDQVELARMLKRLRWPTASEGAPKAGHVMTDHAVASAVRFLDGAKIAPRPPARRRDP